MNKKEDNRTPAEKLEIRVVGALAFLILLAIVARLFGG